MVLYHLTTAYQLLNCMEHRKLFHENDQAVLIIADFLTRSILRGNGWLNWAFLMKFM